MTYIRTLSVIADVQEVLRSDKGRPLFEVLCLSMQSQMVKAATSGLSLQDVTVHISGRDWKDFHNWLTSTEQGQHLIEATRLAEQKTTEAAPGKRPSR